MRFWHMTLYDRIKEQERNIEELRKSVLFCRANGFKVDGEYPHLKEEARGLLEMDAYRHNPVIQEMRDGRKLREIVDEHFSTWKFWRRYSLGEVREFNKSNEPLKGVLPSAGGAEREYFFSAFAPEGCSFCFGAVISSATGFLFYWFGNQEMKEFFPRIIALS